MPDEIKCLDHSLEKWVKSVKAQQQPQSSAPIVGEKDKGKGKARFDEYEDEPGCVIDYKGKGKAIESDFEPKSTTASLNTGSSRTIYDGDEFDVNRTTKVDLSRVIVGKK